jgi:sensor histidine kinase regulating citrate/malate metabolism
MAAIYRHDLRHHLQYVNTCISQSKLEESKDYIKSICREIEQSYVMLYCENDAVNMILSSYVAKAKTKSIVVTISANIPTVIHIATTDLCVILANAIENAIFACENIPDREKRKITLSCRTQNNKLFIQIINTYEGDIAFQEGIPCANSVGHGMGIKSIIHIVKKYQGVYSFDAKDHVFTLSAIV